MGKIQIKPGGMFVNIIYIEHFKFCFDMDNSARLLIFHCYF